MPQIEPSTDLVLPPGGGVIFDMDGLMLDSERIARIAWQKAAALAGYEMSDGLFATLIGRTGADSAGLLQAALGPAFDFETAHTQCNLIYNEHIAQHGLPLKAGVHELLQFLSVRGIPLAVATSTRNPTARRRLEQAGLLSYFSVLVAGDEISHGKPAPDIYLEAVRRLGIDPARSLALEDSFAGVRSAHAAGLRVIMVPDLLEPTEEVRALAFRVAATLHEVMTLLDRRPL